MVTFTDSQVGEILKRLDRVQENAIAIDEERLYWKGVAEKLHETVDERERSIDWFDKRIKSAEEELVMTQNALNKAVDIIVDRNRDLDKEAREVAAWKEREAYQAQQRDILYQENVALREAAETNEVTIVALGDILRGILRSLRSMSEDYHHHRGRFGGTGVASEIDSILNGNGYTQAKV